MYNDKLIDEKTYKYLTYTSYLNPRAGTKNSQTRKPWPSDYIK